MSLFLPESAEAFLAENHVCTLTTIRPDGSPHVAPVRFTWDADAGPARVMTAASRQKAAGGPQTAGAPGG
ncbi:pyridoxamine 5'-phosphate oxidase family protein [Streptomyces sp. NBC_00842]|uniref:pyridoxamine 5'-phosphate oxidase family protein n=1 Tax=unclassified Streptomyces TaxID=2593676 RepID=UPI003865F9BF